MFLVEIYSSEPIDGIIEPFWHTAVQCTKESDRDKNYQMFLERGILPENLRKSQNDE